MAVSPDPPTEGARIFISYSRRDCLELADALFDGLTLARFRPFLDREGISYGEKWRERLSAEIEAADTILFVISPAAVGSEICEWEVAHAIELGKRIVPVYGLDTDHAAMPQNLRDRNYIDFRPNQNRFARLRELDSTLRRDEAWIRQHPRLTEQALLWRNTGASDDGLLTGARLREAEAWAETRPAEAPRARGSSLRHDP